MNAKAEEKTLNKWHKFFIIKCGKMILITLFLRKIKHKKNINQLKLEVHDSYKKVEKRQQILKLVKTQTS